MKRNTRVAAVLLTGVIGVPALAAGSAAAAPPTAKKAPRAITVLVTNDDGVGAAGIDAVVEALRHEKRTKVVVVAPKSQLTGVGSASTPGGAPGAPATTASGYPATAVDGYPIDSVNYALDVLALRPDIVISGANIGQNLGPVSEVSGTVANARQAARRGIPALAVSAQAGAPDYATSSRLAVEWLRGHRSALPRRPRVDGPPLTEVESINVPTCPGGPRGLYETVLAPEGTTEVLYTQDPVYCASTLTTFTSDAQAFNNGWASITKVTVPATAG